MSEDPGWRFPLRMALAAVVHPIRTIGELRGPSSNALVALRVTFLWMIPPPLVLLRSVVWLDPVAESQRWFVWAVLGSGAMSLTGIRWLRSRPLLASSAASLVAQYRATVFIGIGVAEIPALMGVIVVLSGGPLSLGLLGVGVWVVGLAWVAPTSYDIARRQGRIGGAGSSLSLLHTLTQAGAE